MKTILITGSTDGVGKLSALKLTFLEQVLILILKEDKNSIKPKFW
ncbi:hypothetical protein [Aquimarina intermedia]|uniref:Short subunit dehydrogenase n=1 Tax=Aquimarina intermedia TaxID=350814 RepID=A0A5S5C722_9FLAO|nr:hypothetical protein [Aquimarina intermedia]TYP74398.1 hypothetical protein BD809_104218 [Aquimarina intermedia]